MYELMMKYLSGESTTAEKKQLFDTLETDDELRKEFESLQQIEAMTAWLPQEGDEALGVEKLLLFKQKQLTREKRKRIFPWRHVAGYAAAVSMAVLATWFWMMPQKRDFADAQAVIWEELTTPAGQRAMIRLYDGTTVWLNAHTTLRYPHHFDGKLRQVELEGEAYFEVTHNENASFIVSTKRGDIKVLGTIFNVFAYKNSEVFQTALLEGAVEVSTGSSVNDKFRLEPMEMLSCNGDETKKSTFSSLDFLLWKEGIYAFDDQPFNEIIKKLELYYDVTIILNNAKLNNYRFTGKFRQRDGIESVLRTLQRIYKFSYKKDDELNRIIIN